MFLRELADFGLELLKMPYKKAKETFKKNENNDKYEKYINTLLSLIQSTK